MPVKKIEIEEFLGLSENCVILDVRSPSEFAHAHIPGALSFPIFSDEERRIIGTAYKQESREKAIKIGLDFFGRKMVQMVEDAERQASVKASREVGVHCWRGGMRSAAVAWLLDLYGFKVNLLSGGYKRYRRHVLEAFEKKYTLRIVGGYTGGNKTGVIHELARRKLPVIDLEGIAGHKGSAFGNLDNVQQPGQEQFENLLAQMLEKFSSQPDPIWLEGESQRIGNVNIPMPFFATMRASPYYFLDIPFEHRLDHIVGTYGKHEKEKLINATVRIKKRLGGLETKNAVNAILEDDISSAFGILLHYYDRLYLKSTHGDDERKISYIKSDTTDARTNAEKLLRHDRN